MSENVHAEILSVAALQSTDRLAAIGRAIDEFPEFVPTKIGPSDPPRTSVVTVEQHLTAWAPTIVPGDYYVQIMTRRRRSPNSGGILWVIGDIWNYPPLSPHRLDLYVDEDWFVEPDRETRLERFAELFRAEVDAMDAFWGGAGLTSFRRQTNDFVFAAQVAGTLVLPGMPGTGWDMREHCLTDLFWLNYFGPAYLDRWGTAPEQLGVRREPTANGGLIVWATPTPFTFDASARQMTGYAWKRPFYDALGWDSILHEDWRDPGRGVRVPSYEDHRLFYGRRAERESQGRAGSPVLVGSRSSRSLRGLHQRRP
jgi:hypothetical protein